MHTGFCVRCWGSMESWARSRWSAGVAAPGVRSEALEVAREIRGFGGGPRNQKLLKVLQLVLVLTLLLFLRLSGRFTKKEKPVKVSISATDLTYGV